MDVITYSCCNAEWKLHWTEVYNHTNYLLTHSGLVTLYGDRSGSPSARVMTWFLTAPSHYLNQCCLVIKGILWHSRKYIWKCHLWNDNHFVQREMNFGGMSYVTVVSVADFYHLLQQMLKYFYARNVLDNYICEWLLTHWGQDKMAAISQTTSLNAFSWMKMYEFQLKFHWSLLLRAQLTIFHHWFR